MTMQTKEQILYFFLTGTISLSQYDYKFMSNLQAIITTKNRITSNQAALFDNLIHKYKRQLTRQNLFISDLQALPWKTGMVDSLPEYTGAHVYLDDDLIKIRVPFNKNFITQFRVVKNNIFSWDKETKTYVAPFSTTALKICNSVLKLHFELVRFDDNLQNILDELSKYDALVYNPTVKLVNGRLIIGAITEPLAAAIKNITLDRSAKTLFELSQYGISVDPEVYDNQSRIMEFAGNRIYEADITELETIISWMKSIGCENVVLGRGLRNTLNQEGLRDLIQKYGMEPIGPLNFGQIPPGTAILLQQVSNTNMTWSFTGDISKIVVLKDSRSIEVK